MEETKRNTSAIASFWDTSQTMPHAAVEEIERLLGGRTRDIRLNGELDLLFRERSWRQTAKIIRAWMVWVILLDVLTLGINAFLLPIQMVEPMLLPASILPPAACVAAIAFRKPYPFRLHGPVLIASMLLILLSVALVGVNAGGEFYE